MIVLLELLTALYYNDNYIDLIVCKSQFPVRVDFIAQKYSTYNAGIMANAFRCLLAMHKIMPA